MGRLEGTLFICMEMGVMRVQDINVVNTVRRGIIVTVNKTPKVK